jgi:O-methyltransferase
MNDEHRDRYLDLLRDTLSFTLWEEPAVPIEAFNSRRPPAKRFLVALLSRLAGAAGLQLARPAAVSDEKREEGRYWPLMAHTMVGRKRLDNLKSCVESVLRTGVPGDFIEAGVWRGGSAIFIKGILASHDARDRRLFVADSFQGLPPPDAERYPADAGDRHSTFDFLAVSRQQVEDNFRRYGLLDDRVVFVEGWFKDTLPNLPARELALVRIDGDMYESTIDALEALYPKLSPGGYCVVDDYGLKGCRRAVDDFRARHAIGDEMIKIDWTGVYWRRSQ